MDIATLNRMVLKLLIVLGTMLCVSCRPKTVNMTIKSLSSAQHTQEKQYSQLKSLLLPGPAIFDANSEVVKRPSGLDVHVETNHHSHRDNRHLESHLRINPKMSDAEKKNMDNIKVKAIPTQNEKDLINVHVTNNRELLQIVNKTNKNKRAAPVYKRQTDGNDAGNANGVPPAPTHRAHISIEEVIDYDCRQLYNWTLNIANPEIVANYFVEHCPLTHQDPEQGDCTNEEKIPVCMKDDTCKYTCLMGTVCPEKSDDHQDSIWATNSNCVHTKHINEHEERHEQGLD